MIVYIAVINTKKIDKIKLLNGKLVIENEVFENEIKMKSNLKQNIVVTLQL